MEALESTDAVATHERWVATPKAQGGLGELHFPLASDEDGSVCEAYGVYVPRQHVALRGLFIIDPNGVLQYQVVHNLSVGRRAEEVLRVLDGLQTGGLCPSDWDATAPTLDPNRTLGPNSVVGQYRLEAELALERGGGAPPVIAGSARHSHSDRARGGRRVRAARPHPRSGPDQRREPRRDAPLIVTVGAPLRHPPLPRSREGTPKRKSSPPRGTWHE